MMKQCEQCHYYMMIDSGYGNCRRYPPVLQKIRLRGRLLVSYSYEYPVVAFDNPACGESAPRRRGD